jgi:hypothetical protein
VFGVGIPELIVFVALLALTVWLLKRDRRS